MMSKLFLCVVNMSISGSFAALCLLLWRTLTRRRFPAVMYYLLWATLYLRLVLPVSLRSVFSLFSLLAPAAKATPAGSYMVTMQYVNQLPALASPRENRPLQLLSLVWLVVAAALLAGWLVLFCLTRLRLRYGVICKNHPAFCAAKAALKSSGKIKLYASPRIGAPFSTGVFSPRVYVPTAEIETVSEYVLAHELVHLKRQDLASKALAFFITALHWFNPLAWYCLHLFCHDIEASCDEAVLRCYGKAIRPQYARELIRYASQGSALPAGAAGFAENGVARRIAGVLQWQPVSFFKKLCFALTTLLLGLSISTNPVLAAQDFYRPATRLPAPQARRQVADLMADFTGALRRGDTRRLAEITTPDVDYFAPLYGPLAAERPDFQVDKILYTAAGADVYLSDAAGEKQVATLAKSPLMQGYYVDTLEPWADYHASRLVDQSQEAVQLVTRMIRYGVTDADLTQGSRRRIAAFCIDMAASRSGKTTVSPKELAAVAQEFFLLEDFTFPDDPAYFNGTDYLHDPSRGSHFETRILSVDKTPQGATVTVQFFSDPLQTQLEKTVLYSLQKTNV